MLSTFAAVVPSYALTIFAEVRLFTAYCKSFIVSLTVKNDTPPALVVSAPIQHNAAAVNAPPDSAAVIAAESGIASPLLLLVATVEVTEVVAPALDAA